MALTREQQEIFAQIAQTSLPIYSESFLKIRTKTGAIAPFVLNKAQLYAHNVIENQILTTGMVRAVVLKGRQQGLSTYISGRFYRNTSTYPGKRTYILTHEQAASDNLFNMAKRYHDNFPEELRPTLGAMNAKELVFSELDSGYKVATAGNKGAGRSDTAQYVHGSEVAFYPNAEEHIAGILQTVPLMPGTEIIIESTANGIGNVYHSLWQQATAGVGGWVPIFIPWYWTDEYALPEGTPGVTVTSEDMEYGRLHGLSIEQLTWRRRKIDEMQSELLFMQEYPTTPAEAFETSGENSFMSSEPVLRARKVKISDTDNFGPKVLGVDPARSGLDRTVIYLRIGRKAVRLSSINGNDTMTTVGRVLGYIKQYQPHAVFIDQGGIGAGIVDRLRELGYHTVRGVDFGSKPLNDKVYTNKRNEMWFMMKEWIMNQPCQIPDDDSLQEDLTGLLIARYDSHNRAVLESKDEFRKRFHRSPDNGDALALTFAFPVVDYDMERRLERISSNEQFEDYDQVSVPGMGY